MKRVIVVGGGIAGLTAAYRLVCLAQLGGGDLRVVLLEAQDRIGGKILTDRVGDVVLEGGPDSFVTVKPRAMELVRELGLEPQLMRTSRTDTDVYVFVRGRLRRLPEGLLLMAPAKILPFLFSDLLTWRGKLRMALDLVLPAGRVGDVSMGGFTRRRFGREALEAIVQPVMGGIYAGDADAISLQSTFPRFLELERRHGSVIRGLRASAAEARATGQGNASSLTMFVTLAGGLNGLVEAMAERLPPGAVRCGAWVNRISREGAGFRALLNDGESIEGDGVILAAPAWQAAEMVRGLDAELEKALTEIPFSSTATISFVYDAPRLPPMPRGFGFVVARGESRVVTAGTFTGTKFPGRVPVGKTLLRCFLGGAGREKELDQSDAELIKTARLDLRRILGLGPEPQPEILRLYRWPRANPQYTVGHEERVRRIDACAARHRGLALTGASYRGVGIPDCIASGAQAADSLYNLLAEKPA